MGRAVVVVRGDDELLAADVDLVHKVAEKLITSVGRVDRGLSEALVKRADVGLVLIQRRLDVLSLDRSIKLGLLGFERVHGVGGGVVEVPLRDRLDEVGELLFHVCAPSFQCLEYLISATMCLLVVIG